MEGSMRASSLVVLGGLLTLVNVPSSHSAVSAGNPSIEYFGNPIVPSRSGVDRAGVTFMLGDETLAEGILFAFSAYIRKPAMMYFQIWTPAHNASGSNPMDVRDYRLVSQTPMMPSVEYDREDLYIESRLTDKCRRVASGDRVAVYFEEAPSAIGYVFDGNNPEALGYVLPNATVPVEMGETVTFDPLVFPYAFSMAAYVYTNLSVINEAEKDSLDVTCPRGLLIPEYVAPTLPPTTTLPPPSGAPGATGPRGLDGSTGSTGPRGLQGAMGPAGPMGVIGLPGPMGFNGSDGLPGAEGEDGEFGATGYTGPMGPQGATGEQGRVGPMGPAGPPGVTTVNNTRPSAAAQVDSRELMEESVILALIAWCCIITIVLVILVIVVIKIVCFKKDPTPNASYDQYLENYHSTLPKTEQMGKANGAYVATKGVDVIVTSSPGQERDVDDDDGKVDWMGSMREDEFTDYAVATIDRDATRKQKRLSVPQEEVLNY